MYQAPAQQAPATAAYQAPAQSAYQQPYPAMAAPVGVAAAPARKRISPIIPIAIVAAVLLAIVGAGFATGWFGLAKPDAEVRVISAWTQTQVISSSDEVYNTSLDYQRDEQGNLTQIATHASYNDGEEENEVISLTFDSDGVPTSLNMPGFSTMTITPTKDSRGRVASMLYSMDGSDVLRAEYAYYGDSDNVSSITYQSVQEYLGIEYFSMFASTEIAPFITLAIGTLISGSDPCTISFSEDGLATAFTTNGSDVPTGGLDRSSRASQTLTDNGDSYTSTTQYDEQGYVMSTEQKYSDDQTFTSSYEYTTIENPSRWIATIGRLYN